MEEKFPPEGMALAGMVEVYALADRRWNRTCPPTPELAKAEGFVVVPKDLLDKSTAAKDAWEEAAGKIEDWLSEGNPND